MTAVQAPSAGSRSSPTPRVAVRYGLPPAHEIAVRPGDQVARGDLLAHVPRAPTIIAVAHELDAATATLPPAGTRVHAGDALASARRGLRTHVSRAPVSGSIATPQYAGSIMIRPDGEPLGVRARFGGLVARCDARCIVVVTAVLHLPVTYNVPVLPRDLTIVAAEPLLAATFTPRMPIPNLGAHDALVVAHIADVRTLALAQQRTSAALIVGAVSEAVAWELCTGEGSAIPEEAASVCVLAGIGNADTGRRAVASLQEWNGAAALVDHGARVLLLLDERGATAASATLPADIREISFRPPASLGDLGTTSGTFREHALASGLRILAAETTSGRRGAALTPIENFGKSL